MAVWSEAIAQNLVGFATGLLGAVVGGLFTLYAANKAIREENEKERRGGEKEVQNMLDAMGVELGTLWAFHMRRVGGMVEALQPGQALEFYYPLTQDYFTVYNSNAAKIGLIPDPELRAMLVTCYNKCKKVVDGFKYNNELYRDWRDQSDLPSSSSEQQKIKNKYHALVSYGEVIRADHFELKGYMEELLRLLNKRGRGTFLV